MPFPPSLRALRYARSWVLGTDGLAVEEIALDRDGTPVPASVVEPRRPRGPLPGWIVLHGITRPGRAHRQLVRFSRALASTGCRVLVPEVPEWRALDLAPTLTAPTVRAALRTLAEIPGGRAEPPALVGFSFGSPQAVAASAAPDLREELAGVVGFGGYFDLERTIRFQLTGRHEWRGRAHHHPPDPYGRWICGANYLPHVPGHEARTDVADALRRLAAEAGDVGKVAWDPVYEPLKQRLRETLPEEALPVYDLFAPPHGREPEPRAAEAMAAALAGAARRVDPAIEPGAGIAAAPGPVHVLHGYNDHLIPFTEAYRMADALPDEARAAVTVTRLFGHSAQDPFPWLSGPAETWRFLRALAGMLALA